MKCLLPVLLAAIALSGCGRAPLTAGPMKPAALSAAAKKQAPVSKDHAALNALVAKTLADHQTHLSATDPNANGVITRAEYAVGRSAEATALYFAQFDGNKDGGVTPAEFAAALKKGDAVEAYHHFLEAKIEGATKGYLADGDFDVTDLREYITTDLGSMADWPLLFRIMGEVDLNADEKLMNSAGEGHAFVLKFGRAHLAKEVALPLSEEFVARR